MKSIDLPEIDSPLSEITQELSDICDEIEAKEPNSNRIKNRLVGIVEELELLQKERKDYFLREEIRKLQKIVRLTFYKI